MVVYCHGNRQRKNNDTRIENIGLTVAPITEELAEKFDLDRRDWHCGGRCYRWKSSG